MKKIIVNLVAISVLMWTGCKKNDNTGSADTAAFNTGMQSLISTYQPAKHVVTVSADNGGEIIGTSSRFTFSPGAFTNSSGTTVTGNVQVEYQEFSTKGQMILGNKTTKGTEGMLESSGEVYINVTQNGNQLQVKPSYSSMSFHGTSFTKPMSYYSGTVSGSLGDISWQKTSDTITLAYYTAPQCTCATAIIDPNAGYSYYDTLYTFSNINIPSLGWVNCDYFNSYPGGTTNLTINTPAGFTNNNIVVYIAYKTINTVARFPWDGSEAPLGLPATIVAFGYHNGQWYSCFKDITITSNDVESITMTPTTVAAYANAVAGL